MSPHPGQSIKRLYRSGRFPQASSRRPPPRPPPRYPPRYRIPAFHRPASISPPSDLASAPQDARLALARRALVRLLPHGASRPHGEAAARPSSRGGHRDTSQFQDVMTAVVAGFPARAFRRHEPPAPGTHRSEHTAGTFPSERRPGVKVVSSAFVRSRCRVSDRCLTAVLVCVTRVSNDSEHLSVCSSAT